MISRFQKNFWNTKEELSVCFEKNKRVKSCRGADFPGSFICKFYKIVILTKIGNIYRQYLYEKNLYFHLIFMYNMLLHSD